MLGDGQPGVRRGVLGDEADLGQLRRAVGGAAAAHLDRARRRRQQAGGQAQQGGLPGAVGADQPDDPPGRDVEGAVRQRPAPPVSLAQSLGPQDGRVRLYAGTMGITVAGDASRRYRPEVRFERHDRTFGHYATRRFSVR